MISEKETARYIKMLMGEDWLRVGDKEEDWRYTAWVQFSIITLEG